MRKLPSLRLAAVPLIVLACSEPVAVAPTSPPTLPQTARSCALGLSDADASALITDLIAEVNALESSGALSSGNASALRSHLESILQSFAGGNYCAAAAQLQAFLRQVENFVRGGVLTEEEGDTLTDGASDVLEGPKDQLTFVTDRDGNREIYIVTSDASGLHNLTNDGGSDEINSSGGWSPDGTRLVFQRGQFLSTPDIYVIHRDGSGETLLTTSDPLGGGPRWSPDGTRIVFASARDGNTELYIVNPDGSGITRVTTSLAPQLNIEPKWSPDASTLAFSRCTTSPGLQCQVYTIRSDGTGETNVSNDASLIESTPVWSPDGTRLAFPESPTSLRSAVTSTS